MDSPFRGPRGGGGSAQRTRALGGADPAAHRRVLETLTGVPATDGNRVAVLRNGEQIFPAMLGAISAAQRTIDLMTYVYWRGGIARRMAEVLGERARAGVRVRLVVDAFGAKPMDDALVAGLSQAGAVVEVFRPLRGWKVWKWNMRTHRRVLVCDEQVAFTGGAGIAGEWEGNARNPREWRDTHFRVEGPAVDGVHAAFLSDWLELDHPIVTEADRFPEHGRRGSSSVQVLRAASQPGWNDVAVALAGLLVVARRRIRVTSAYLRLPRYFLSLLREAVRRGVDVDVLVPGRHCHPAHYRWAAEYHYEDLLDGGVRVWHYQPTMHHAKIVTVDGLVSLVGTTNLDARSLAINEQVGLLVHDADVTAELDGHFEEDLGHSERVDPAAWAHRGTRQRLREQASHLATFGVRGAGASRYDGLLTPSFPEYGHPHPEQERRA